MEKIYELFGIGEIYELEIYDLATTCYYLCFLFVCLALLHTYSLLHTYLVVGGMDRGWYVYAWFFIFHIYTYMHRMTCFEIVTYFSHKWLNLIDEHNFRESFPSSLYLPILNNSCVLSSSKRGRLLAHRYTLPVLFW